MNFAVLYSILSTDAWHESKSVLGVLDSFYYSLVKITALGYGEIIPISSFPKIRLMDEVIAGIVLIVFSLAVYMTYAGCLIS
ncbi:ion channel [Halodesulfovibrio spirochaetisodalis]|uniref:ion channel n=1 Tax=Halodesulfovibrio spirochaetisodalis TaxID=1560234 RepID=UPI0009EE3894